MKEETKVKKRMKTWQKILVVVLIVFAIFAIDTFRKFKIIRGIEKQYETDLNSSNLYQRAIGMQDGIDETYIYNNIRMFKNTINTEEGKTERIIYSDKDKKESWIIVNSLKEKVAVQLEYQDNAPIAGISTPIGIGTQSAWVELLCSIKTQIKSDKWATKDCYQICFNFEDQLVIWVDKESNRRIGERNGYTSGLEGYLKDNISTYYYKENELTEDDVKLPDLTGYIIKDSQGNVIEQR